VEQSREGREPIENHRATEEASAAGAARVSPPATAKEKEEEMKVNQIAPLFLAVAFAACAPNSLAQARRDAGAEKPAPDLANVKYGLHERNVLDLWKAKSGQPAPLLVFIHGGGFRAGSKESLAPGLLKRCLDSGISVMAINYRLSPEVHFPAHYMDCARAIQFARHNAKEWNLDPKRVASSGGSAGAGTSLWIGFHDDLADPKNSDPVVRESTRLTCVAVMGAQSTYDPRVISEWVSPVAAKHPALRGFYGLSDDELDSPKAHKLYEQASPINFLTKDDPPVFAFYNEADRPIPADAPPGAGIHHPIFGKKLNEKMDALKIECVVKHADDYRRNGGDMNEEIVQFLKRHFAAGRK
jgi:acetyl esterase/lipase